jgi:large subunit ribosomal protein L21
VAGGRQHRVAPGEVVRVDRLRSAAGAEVVFDKVLLFEKGGAIRVGDPTVPGASVKARVIEERRDRKVLVFKMKHRKGYRKSRGHRQWYTLVRIEAIEPGD